MNKNILKYHISRPKKGPVSMEQSGPEKQAGPYRQDLTCTMNCTEYTTFTSLGSKPAIFCSIKLKIYTNDTIQLDYSRKRH